MSKFHDTILKDFKVSAYKYAPESLKVIYKNENITNLIDNRHEFAINFINNNVKFCQDALKRAIRKNSKFSVKHKKVKLYVVLNDNTSLSCDSYMLYSRYSNLEQRLFEYKSIKEYLNTKTIDTATLGANYDIDEVKSEYAFENNYIKYITYI